MSRLWFTDCNGKCVGKSSWEEKVLHSQESQDWGEKSHSLQKTWRFHWSGKWFRAHPMQQALYTAHCTNTSRKASSICQECCQAPFHSSRHQEKVQICKIVCWIWWMFHWHDDQHPHQWKVVSCQNMTDWCYYLLPDEKMIEFWCKHKSHIDKVIFAAALAFPHRFHQLVNCGAAKFTFIHIGILSYTSNFGSPSSQNNRNKNNQCQQNTVLHVDCWLCFLSFIFLFLWLSQKTLQQQKRQYCLWQ